MSAAAQKECQSTLRCQAAAYAGLVTHGVADVSIHRRHTSFLSLHKSSSILPMRNHMMQSVPKWHCVEPGVVHSPSLTVLQKAPGAQVTSGAVTVGRQKLFHQHVLNSSPLKMQISSGSPTTTICSAFSQALQLSLTVILNHHASQCRKPSLALTAY